MRLLAGAAVCLLTLNLISTSAVSAAEVDPFTNAHVLPAGRANWLAIDHTNGTPLDNSTVPSVQDSTTKSPVVLPIPAEGWACITLLAWMAGFRGLKRARII